jgi:hypothetical protein
MSESLLRKAAIRRLVNDIDDNVPRSEMVRILMEELFQQVNCLLDEK